MSGAVGFAGFALLLMVIASVVSPWFERRRSPRYVPLAILLADVGVSLVLGGVVFGRTSSPDTGVTTGVIAFCVIGVVAIVAMRLWRARTLAARG